MKQDSFCDYKNIFRNVCLSSLIKCDTDSGAHLLFPELTYAVSVAAEGIWVYGEDPQSLRERAKSISLLQEFPSPPSHNA